jgi:hypothetical protein
MTVPTNAQLLETTALPMAVIVQPFAQLRYDEAPIPLVSSWTSGTSAFDSAQEEEGPPRCDKCRGYINPWARFVDGGQKWICNLCATTNPGKSSKDLNPFTKKLILVPPPRSHWSAKRPPRASRTPTRDRRFCRPSRILVTSTSSVITRCGRGWKPRCRWRRTCIHCVRPLGRTTIVSRADTHGHSGT